LEQNKDNFALKPRIGWMIRKKNVRNDGVKNKLKTDARQKGREDGISIRVKEFPSVLLELTRVNKLKMEFTDEIDIPDELAKVKIGELELSGRIDEEGIDRIRNLFPDTEIRVNGRQAQ